MYPKDLSARRLLGVSLCSMLFGIFLAMLGGSVYVHLRLSAIRYADPVQAPVPSLSMPDSHTPPATADDLSQTSSSDSQVIHLLLIGQDRREGETVARSDAMILCSFDFTRNTITLTSLLRDLYLPIPGHGSNRLNAAYAFGGMSLLKQTLEENFGISPVGCLEVDFSGFSEIIDHLGGVRIDLRHDEAEYLGLPPEAGPQLLCGDQALSYARIRSLDNDGDFSRTDRQRKLLSAMMEAGREASFPTLVRTAGKILPLLTTDLTRDQLFDLARQVFPMLRSCRIQSQYIPQEGTYTFQNIDSMAVLVADPDAIREHFSRYFSPGETDFS